MKKILLILLLAPLVSLGQSFYPTMDKDDTIPILNINPDSIPVFKLRLKGDKAKWGQFISVSNNLSFAQKNFNQIELGFFHNDIALRSSLTLDNSYNPSYHGTHWLGVKLNFELTDTDNNCFFINFHPKVSTQFNDCRFFYGLTYMGNKNKLIQPTISFNFEQTDFILSFGINFNFKYGTYYNIFNKSI